VLEAAERAFWSSYDETCDCGRHGGLLQIGDRRTDGPRSAGALTTSTPAVYAVAARRDAGQHPLEHHVGELVTRGEVLVALQFDLAAAVGGPGARAADRDPAATQRDLAALMAMADRGAVRIVAAPRADNLIDLEPP
jgi:hypothetical protein